MAFEDVGWGDEDNLKNQGLSHHWSLGQGGGAATDGGNEHGVSWEPWEKTAHIRYGPM